MTSHAASSSSYSEIGDTMSQCGYPQCPCVEYPEEGCQAPAPVPPPGEPTELGWMLSCSGVHPEAVKIVEAFQAENNRYRDALVEIERQTQRMGGDFSRVNAVAGAALKAEAKRIGPLPEAA